MTHIPVLLNEVLIELNPKPNDNFIDCTVGEGGHSKEILKKIAPNGLLLGIDRNNEQIKRAEKNLAEFGKRVILTRGKFSELKKIVLETKFPIPNGIIFDLGFSSAELTGHGLSFLKDEVLDMRYDKDENIETARDIINNWPIKKITEILYEYGNERYAKRIVENIIKERKVKKINTTFELSNLIKKSYPRNWKHGINPSTRVFQALRIAVNNEFEEIKQGLRTALEIVDEKGIILVISFHSGEDRIVKNILKEYGKVKLIRASKEEILKNKRSRSAKMRVLK
ncbi:MAG: 16S rRNA (cytosine(1402)-N(4))-methyltransferase RsmH [Patescibacteria group bacterium]